jgi:hypothetical protein
MAGRQKRSYLFLLKRPGLDAGRQAAERLRELGMIVVARFGTVAVEALATEDQLAAAPELGLFAAQLNGPMAREHLAKLSGEQRRILTLWNTRFTPGYRKLKEDVTHAGKPWDAEGMMPPLGSSLIDVEDFLEFVAEWERRTGERLAYDGGTRRPGRRLSRAPRPMSAREFVAFERSLAETYKDETIGYRLARLGYRLDPARRNLLFTLPVGLLEELFERYFDEPACWEMTGEMAVGIVFVESSRREGPKFSTTERDQICQEIFDGHSLLTREHPSGNLSWVYDLQFVTIDVANGSGDPMEAYWRDPAMGQVVYNGNSYAAAWSSVAEYRDHMRDVNRSAHAFVIFVTPYANRGHGYASSGRVTLANRNDWGGWGRANIDRITAHETCHLFGAADEYSGNSGTPCSSCSTTHGCDKIPNGNCAACASPQQDCMMTGNHRRICNYTRGQIGWATLFVETKTADMAWADTDDSVWVDIGDRQFELDTAGHDDRERGNIEGYAIWAPELRRADVKRILLRKSPDSLLGAFGNVFEGAPWGGWRLERVRAWFQGELVCEADVNRWLMGDRRVWVGCVADRDLVSELRVKITTADVRWASTDDDVSIRLAGRDWNLDNPAHGDFERGNTDTFDLDPGSGLYRSAINSVRIRKSPDGIGGGWKLKGVEVIVNGATIFNDQSINRWLEDDDRIWFASF